MLQAKVRRRGASDLCV